MRFDLSRRVAWLVFILLSGCSRPYIQTEDVYQMGKMQHWYQLSNWQFEGRLGVVAEQDSFTANINWLHEKSNDVIVIAGPLGQGRVRLVVTATQVEVDDGDVVRVYQEPIEQVMKKYFGLELPVRAFQFWLLGLAEPGVDYQERELGFVQHGWRVIYRQMQGVDAHLLPRKINMEKAKTKVKLILDQWKLS